MAAWLFTADLYLRGFCVSVSPAKLSFSGKLRLKHGQLVIQTFCFACATMLFQRKHSCSRNFCKPGSPGRERHCQLRDANLLFTSLLRGGLSSSRETVPTLWRPICYLHHFWEAVAQFARDSANFVTPDRLCTSLPPGGVAISGGIALTSRRPADHLHDF